MARPVNSTHSTRPRPHAAASFQVRRRGDKWFVKQGRQWRAARELAGSAPMLFLPNGEIRGYGVVTRRGKSFAITG
jgi:hypothetical protein